MAKSYLPRLQHILDSIQVIRTIIEGRELFDLQEDRIRQLALERSFEIISEASRHLPDELKARHPDIPWKQVAGIGNVLRHNYDDVAPRLLWATIRERLPALEKVCGEEINPRLD